MTDSEKENFSDIAKSSLEKPILSELFDFLKTNKKWWLAPILIVMLLLGALLFLSTTAAAPFIYTLF